MPLTSIQIGRIGQGYAKKQAVWGVAETLAAANAVRHLQLTFPGSDNKNKRSILDKTQSPFLTVGQRGDSRTTAGFNLQAILRPSGTINIVPELDPYFECAFGSKINTVLSTTVASGGTVSGATLTSGAGLAVGGVLLITCPDGKKRSRFLASVAGAVVTWVPDLPSGQAPATSAVVKSGLVYKVTSSLILNLTIGHYLKNLDATAGFKRVADSCMVDKLSIDFDANDDPKITASGPARILDTATAQAQPGGFTLVGTQPPSGILGELMLGNTGAKFLKLGVNLSNSLKIRNESYGYSSGEEGYRIGRAEIGVDLDMRAESETVLYDLTETGTNVPVFLQGGFTEGNIIAVRLPNVEFKVPDTDDPDEEVNFNFKGMGLDTSDGALDGLQFALC